MKIDEFPDYTFDGENVYNKKGKQMKRIYSTRKNGDNGFYKLKNTSGKFVQLSHARMLSLTGNILKLPEDAIEVYKSDGKTFITPSGDVYNYGWRNPQGIKYSRIIKENKYPSITLWYKDRRQRCDIHMLVVENFIMKDYTSKGLCCLHADDDKTNCDLSNLSVGTYSQNNKDSWLRVRRKK